MRAMALALIIMVLVLVGSTGYSAEGINETFENFSIGSIDGQGSWTSGPTGGWDSISEVVSSPTHSGSRSLHLSGFVSNATYTVENPAPPNAPVTVSFWYREQYGFGTNDTGNNMSLRNAVILSDGYNQHTTYANICHAGTGHRSLLMTADAIGNGSCINGVGDMTEGIWYFIEIQYDFENRTAHGRVDGGDWGDTIDLRVYGGAEGSFIASFSAMSIWDNPPQFWFDDLFATILPPALSMPVPYVPANFGWKYMSYADYRNATGQTYYVYHPAADLNVAGDESGNVPVYVIADGEIAANSKTWGGIVIKHDIAGQTYYSQYGHLKHLKDESQLQIGEPVKRGDQIGFVGNVGKVPYHLHFEVRSPYHPNPTYAPYWDNTATVSPDKLSRKNVFIGYESPLAFVDTYGDPSSTVVIVDDAVTYPGIAQDIVDNTVQIDVHETGLKETVKRRFFQSSKLYEWHPAYNGENVAYEGSYHYTLSTPDSATAYGRWYFDIPVAGNYEVLVSIPSGTQTKQARYAVYHNNRQHYVTVDQSAVSAETDIAKRWLSLGTFVFQQGSKNWVHLSNKTGETNLKVGYDALKLIKQ